MNLYLSSPENQTFLLFLAQKIYVIQSNLLTTNPVINCKRPFVGYSLTETEKKSRETNVGSIVPVAVSAYLL